MIKKQSIWALTLFSLILVLSIYYITLPDELEVKNKANKTVVNESADNKTVMTLKTLNEEEKNNKIKELQKKLNDEKITKEEKNNAYDELKQLNIIKSKEEEISLKIKNKFKLENFIQINDEGVKVVVIKKDHTPKLASDIMKEVQSYFDEKKYISIKFENN